MSKHLKCLFKIAIRDEAGNLDDGIMVRIQPCKHQAPDQADTNQKPFWTWPSYS